MKGNITMKCDITRAWKDENYRQSLSEEELSTLPANPVGELCDSELSNVCGGFDGNGVGAFGVATSSSAFHGTFRGHSYALLCDINVFSADIHVLGLDRLINIGNCETRPCLNND